MRAHKHSWVCQWQAAPSARGTRRERGSSVCASPRATELGSPEPCTSLGSSNRQQWRHSCNSDTLSRETKRDGVWLLLIDLLKERGSGWTRGWRAHRVRDQKGKPERRRLLRVVIQLRERVQRSWLVAYAMCAQALVYSCVDAFCISRSSEATWQTQMSI